MGCMLNMNISEEIKGLTDKEIQDRKEKGQVNITDDRNTKTNWEIVSENIFTLFNLFNFLIAVDSICLTLSLLIPYWSPISCNVIGSPKNP